ncbi:Qat anti-phage system QueC-like protein QatC [uncultured Clostridium sp.]|uniref:Qat anti-phage system QueC-like protein QatC n=1 Tax=uncultured Clostridium sp. TaxID=59620 RepID=UPI0026393348|nr:Qat anti-phage system QueC-like protein QatC [uncultured Clostridium sp.]
MKIWINKCEDEFNSSDDMLVFNLNNKSKSSNIKTDLENIWRRFGKATISDINEDLLIIALSIFAIDKRIERKGFRDSWTRDLEVSIPVLELEKWSEVKVRLEKMLGFLSGDIWSINFRKTDKKFRGNKLNKYNVIKNINFDCVSLFSGGLDSFTGVVKLLESSKKVCLVGFKEYGSLANRQRDIYSIIDKNYNDINKDIILFKGTAYAPLMNNKKEEIYSKGVESTSRSRSFLFIAGALATANIIGDTIPVYIPENGFIGLNVSLTMSRKGTCSTRTTHPYFLKELNNILGMLGINNRVENFYAFKSKGEMVDEMKGVNAFKQGANSTISCSHPCLARYDGLKTPLNCGYCYPCLIRKAAMNKIGVLDDNYNFNYNISKEFIDDFNKVEGRASDLKAVLWSLNRYLSANDRKSIKKLVIKTGNLETSETEKMVDVYIKSMEELKAMIVNETENDEFSLLNYIGGQSE